MQLCAGILCGLSWLSLSWALFFILRFFTKRFIVEHKKLLAFVFCSRPFMFRVEKRKSLNGSCCCSVSSLFSSMALTTKSENLIFIIQQNHSGDFHVHASIFRHGCCVISGRCSKLRRRFIIRVYDRRAKREKPTSKEINQATSCTTDILLSQPECLNHSVLLL